MTELLARASGTYSILDLIQGSVITQAISVAAKLGVADVLAQGPLPVEEIAVRVGADADAIHRLLRTLSGYGVFVAGDGGYALTPMAEALREDSPDSMRGLAVLMGHPLLWEIWGQLLESVRTGEASLPKVHGMGAYEFIGSQPEFAEVFFQGMRSMSDLEVGPVVEAYDFSEFATVVDVVGGAGGLLARILDQAPRARGVLFDSKFATANAQAVFEAASVADRYTVTHGGHFDPLPDGANAYILKHILHDFAEEQCLALLRNVREAIAPDGKLLVIEYVLTNDNERHLGNLIDLWLLLLLGAQERTLAQYTGLLARAGFQVQRAVPTSSPVSVIEAIPV